MKKLLIIAVVIFSILACNSDNPKNKAYTLEQLEQNKQNSLGIESIEKPDLMALNQKMGEAKKEEIEKLLQKKDSTF